MSSSNLGGPDDSQEQAGKQQLPGLHEVLSSTLGDSTTLTSRFSPVIGVSSQYPGILPPISNSYIQQVAWQSIKDQVPPILPSIGPRSSPVVRLLPNLDPNIQACLPLSVPQLIGSHYDSLPSSLSWGISGGTTTPGSSNFPALTDGESRRDSARTLPSTGRNSIAAESSDAQDKSSTADVHVLEDGTVLPAMIDGEPVNPMWGTTKAGKARKRLAQACLSCREKKIKCDPRTRSCLQCQKGNRNCIMPATFSMPRASISISPGDSSSTLSVYTSQSIGTRHNTSYLLRNITDEEENTASRLQQDSPSSYDGVSNDPEKASDMKQQHDTISGRVESDSYNIGPPSTPEQNCVDNRFDPYLKNPIETLRLLDKFYTHSCPLIRQIVAADISRSWVTSAKRKDENECMVLYTMLALGAALTSDHSQFAEECAQMATNSVAANLGQPSLALIQARIFMMMCAQAWSRNVLAAEYLAAAIHLIDLLNLTTDQGCVSYISRAVELLYGMNPLQTFDCCKRTVLTCFVFDKIYSLMWHHDCLMSGDHINLSLSTKDIIQDVNIINAPPLLTIGNGSTMFPFPPASSFVSLTNTLIDLCKISSRVIRFTTMKDVDSKSYWIECRDFAASTTTQIGMWHKTLPTHLNMNTNMNMINDNLNISKDEGDLLRMIRLVYYTINIHMSRFIVHIFISDLDQLGWNIEKAYQSAYQLLICTAQSQDVQQPEVSAASYPHDNHIAFTTYALLCAIDTTTAVGLVENLHKFLPVLVSCHNILSNLWTRGSGEYIPRLQIVANRITQLHNLVYASDKQILQDDLDIIDIGLQRLVWRFRRSILAEHVVPLEHDVMYGSDLRVLANAVGLVSSRIP